MEDNITTIVLEDDVAPNSVLAQMLASQNVTPEELYSSLTNEQLRAMGSFTSPRTTYMPDLLRNTISERTRIPHTRPLPGWIETNPLRLAEDTMVSQNIEWTEELKRRNEALKKNTAEQLFRDDFSRHISAAMAGKTVVGGPEQLNNGEITMTTSYNSGNVLANLRYSQENKSKADMYLRAPAPSRPSLPPPVPDVTIYTITSGSPRARSSPAPAPSPSSVIVAPRAGSVPAGISISAVSPSSLTSKQSPTKVTSDTISPVITSVRTLTDAQAKYASLASNPTVMSSAPISSVTPTSRAGVSKATPATSPVITSVRTLTEAAAAYETLASSPSISISPVPPSASLSPVRVTPAATSPVITSVRTLADAASIASTPTVSPAPVSSAPAPVITSAATYPFVSVAPTICPAPATVAPASVSPVITSIYTLADAPTDASPAPAAATPTVIAPSTPGVGTYPSARPLKTKNNSHTNVVDTAIVPSAQNGVSSRAPADVVPTPVAALLAAAASPCDEPYGDNQLLVEVENPERRKRRSTKRPRLISESGSYVCMEDWQEMVGLDGGAAAADGPDYSPGRGPRKKARRRARTSREAAPTPPRRTSGGSVDKQKTRQSFKQRLHAQLQADSGKRMKLQEVDAMLLGPAYAEETLDDTEVFQEFVQLVVTKVYATLPCSSMLLTALQPYGDTRAAPTEFFTDLIEKTNFSKGPTVRVQYAACLPEEPPFNDHVFKEPHTKLEEPIGAIKLLHEKIESMHAVRKTVTQAAERFRQQLEVIKAFLMPPAVALAPRPAPPPPCPRPGPLSRTRPRRLEARLPVTTLRQFRDLDEDLRADPELKMELLTIYREIMAKCKSSWECVRYCMEKTLTPPVDEEYSGSGRPYKGQTKGNYGGTVPYQCLEEAMSENFGDQENMEKLKSRVGKWLCTKKGPA